MANNNKYVNAVAVSKDRSCVVKYIAQPMRDKSGVLITRKYDGEFTPVVTFIDCGEYVSTAVRTESKSFALMSRAPSSKYVPALSEEMRRKINESEGHNMVTVKTNEGNTMFVHLAQPDHEAGVFKKLIVTINDGYDEKVVAHAVAEDDDEITVTAFGYPAGYEVET